MEVYLVRHGQTDGNVAFRHQHPLTPLNEVGILQVKQTAKQLKKLNPTHIISSTQLRAVQSARIIIDCCQNITPVTCSSFEEFHRPDNFFGVRILSKETFFYIFAWFLNQGTYEKGESYKDFVLRLSEARLYLESLPKDSRVVVVSHKLFINMFVEYICRKKPIGIFSSLKLILKMARTENASIKTLVFDPEKRDSCAWRVKK